MIRNSKRTTHDDTRAVHIPGVPAMPGRSARHPHGRRLRAAAALCLSASVVGCGGEAPLSEQGPAFGAKQSALSARQRGGRSEEGAIVLDWVETAFEVVRTQSVGTPAAGRLYAMTFAAMFDAVNGIGGRRGPAFQHAIVPPDGSPRRANRQAAAAAAAHAVLSGLAPGAQELLDEALEVSTASLRGRVAAGLAWGRFVGERTLAVRSVDGTQVADVVTPPSADPGVFRTTFDRRYANMEPFAIDSSAPYLLGEPPPALTSAEYAAGENEIFVKGSEEDDDPRRQAIALQWETPSGTIRPTGSAIQGAVALARSECTDRQLLPTARLFALVGMAVADTLIPIWHDKAAYLSWRPKPAIQRADEDGNPSTTHDPDFQTRFGSTGGSPEYPSGQAAFTSAVATVLEGFYEDRHLRWCFGSDANPAGRCYRSARDMGDEGGLSRVFQGVHFRFTVEASRPVGTGVGREVVETALRRNTH